ncbi:MAG: hypothetical protein Q9222_001068 [Ikaeria aurantiellina]
MIDNIILFGVSRPWLPPPWHTSDDRVRGGSSRSSISAAPENSAIFEGHLDIETLGGAGFASQFQSITLGNDDDESASAYIWNLSTYNGIELDLSAGDAKVYTLVLKDEEPQEKRDDGREKAGISWEAEFRVSNGNEAREQKVWFPWDVFKATYRGKEKEGAGQLKPTEIHRIGLMMRRHVSRSVWISKTANMSSQSYFGSQQGAFRLQLRSISARKQPSDSAELAASLQE